jgi:Fur family transcriptional regulator, ferric uptake regulator
LTGAAGVPLDDGVRQSRQERLEQVIGRLRGRGARLTRKRERLLQALLETDRPASAEEIRERASLPATDLVTVYRTLEMLEEVGVMQKFPLENGTHLYELTAPDEHYHHLVCRRCHRSERLDVCLGDTLLKSARRKGYSEITHLLEVYGLCADCAQTAGAGVAGAPEINRPSAPSGSR